MTLLQTLESLDPQKKQAIESVLENKELDDDEKWRLISTEQLSSNDDFAIHEGLFESLQKSHSDHPPYATFPTKSDLESSHISSVMKNLGFNQYEEFYRWSISNREEFWKLCIDRLQIPFQKKPNSIVDLSQGVENPAWLPGAELNAFEACFQADRDSIAVRFQKNHSTPIEEWTYAELRSQSLKIAKGLRALGLKSGDAVAIDMVMTHQAVAIYLGILAAGGVVVSIADSFAPAEIATRLRIGDAKWVFTQGKIKRGEKLLPLYEKVVEANAPQTIVLDAESVKLREGDLNFEDFLPDSELSEVATCRPHDSINILFSSGTTGDPKAIPWNHTTAIKAATDGMFHQDIREGHVVCWPTNLGWMMGPWLIFATLMNRATIGLFFDAPNTLGFCQFVERASVNILGVVPSLLKTWRSQNLLRQVDWSQIHTFSSTGEVSQFDDVFYLMSRANYRPVIEYCGGTEVGGGYVSGTVVQPGSPNAFSTPSLGLELRVLDEAGQETTQGEVFLVPPSMGLSLFLLNRDHHEVYFEGTPQEGLRRHGDEIEKLSNGYFRAHGRVDDTMNLGGIKVSSADLERAMNTSESVRETAAIAVPPKGGGPSELVVYAVSEVKTSDLPALQKDLQTRIRQQINPLFKIQDLVVCQTLPRTASNKVMRRVLRDQYLQSR